MQITNKTTSVVHMPDGTVVVPGVAVSISATLKKHPLVKAMLDSGALTLGDETVAEAKAALEGAEAQTASLVKAVV